jgi:glycosyltransferase involved in cell wall biosynthesis
LGGNLREFVTVSIAIARASLQQEGAFPKTKRSEQAATASRGSAAEAPLDQSGVLLWHWGQAGAGAKFTFELMRELRKVPGITPNISAVEGSELAGLIQSLDDVPAYVARTFKGNKNSLSGKLAAARGVLRLPRLARDFEAFLSEQQCDIAISTMMSIWDSAALLGLRRTGTRFILVLHDAKLHPGDAYPFREMLMRREIEAADALIVLSDHVRQEVQALYGFPGDRIWTVPHGAFAFGQDAPKAREFTGERPVRLLFFGRILAYKGLDHLLNAYRILHERNVPVELEIVGSGDMAPYERHLQGLQGVTVLNKWVGEDEIADAIARTDLVVLPYIEASQSGVAAAALTAGLPIVATPVGGLVEQVADRQTGIIAKGMTAADLADAIRSLSDPVLYRHCSEGGLRYARDELGWSRIATQVSEIVSEVRSLPLRRGPSWR